MNDKQFEKLYESAKLRMPEPPTGWDESAFKERERVRLKELDRRINPFPWGTIIKWSIRVLIFIVLAIIAYYVAEEQRELYANTFRLWGGE